MAQTPKGRLVQGLYKPIHGTCAMYFSLSVFGCIGKKTSISPHLPPFRSVPRGPSNLTMDPCDIIGKGELQASRRFAETKHGEEKGRGFGEGREGFYQGCRFGPESKPNPGTNI